jgi:hypothetical protein
MAANAQSREVALERLAANDQLNADIVAASRPAAQRLLLNPQ